MWFRPSKACPECNEGILRSVPASKGRDFIAKIVLLPSTIATIIGLWVLGEFAWADFQHSRTEKRYLVEMTALGIPEPIAEVGLRQELPENQLKTLTPVQVTALKEAHADMSISGYGTGLAQIMMLPLTSIGLCLSIPSALLALLLIYTGKIPQCSHCGGRFPPSGIDERNGASPS